MYLKSDQKKHQKNTDLWSRAIYLGEYACDEFDCLAAESVSAPEWTTEGWVQRFVLSDRHSLNARCGENSVAQRSEIRC